MVSGIENQIAINRVADYAKQTADRVYQAENAKEFAAHMQKEKVAHEAQNVNETEHAEQNRIQQDKDGKSGGEGGQQDRESKGQTAEDGECLQVMPSETLGKEIDISI